jgi:hypothetical protein
VKTQASHQLGYLTAMVIDSIGSGFCIPIAFLFVTNRRGIKLAKPAYETCSPSMSSKFSWRRFRARVGQRRIRLDAAGAPAQGGVADLVSADRLPAVVHFDCGPGTAGAQFQACGPEADLC